MSQADLADTSESYDPFEEFNRAQGLGLVRDPYPGFAELRKQGGVVRLDLAQLLGRNLNAGQGDGTGPPPFRPAGMPDEIYMALSHEAVSRVLRDGETFSSKAYGMTIELVMGHTILGMDEPEHGRYRGLVQKAFTRRALDRWEAELIRPVVNDYIDRFAGRGRADLVRELTFPFPVRVIAGMLGLPAEDLARFHRWAVELISITVDLQRGLRASQALRDYFAGILAERRREPREDLISVLAQAELEDGARLSDEDIFSFLRLLLPAGAETTYRSSSNLLFGLLTHTDQLDALRRDRSLMNAAIEEGLRWEPPLLGIMRLATRDVEIEGCAIPKGAIVNVNLGAANHDSLRWNDPETFDIFREARQHMAFAFGAHRCLGMHLARVETEVVMSALLDRFPSLRLDPEAKDLHITGMIFRTPLSLPVLFDPA
jgi:cytochrome P450